MTITAAWKHGKRDPDLLWDPPFPPCTDDECRALELQVENNRARLHRLDRPVKGGPHRMETSDGWLYLVALEGDGS